MLYIADLQYFSQLVHHSITLPYDAIPLYGTVIHRHSNGAVIPCIKSFPVNTHDHAPQVMQLPMAGHIVAGEDLLSHQRDEELYL